jgi:hypothetical protein
MKMAITTVGSCLMLAMLAAPVRAVLLDVSPLFTVALGVGSFSVDVRASGVPADEVITGFNLLLGYDKTKIVPRSVIFSGALGSLTPTCDDDPDNCETGPSSVLDFDPVADAPSGYSGYLGQSTIAVQFENLSLSFDPITDLKTLQSPEPFTLATILFEILPTGGVISETLLELMNDNAYTTVPPDTGGNFDVKGKEGNNILTSTTQNGSALIPVPATLLLMLAPLCAVIFRRCVFTRTA